MIHPNEIGEWVEKTFTQTLQISTPVAKHEREGTDETGQPYHVFDVAHDGTLEEEKYFMSEKLGLYACAIATPKTDDRAEVLVVIGHDV